MQSLNHLYNDVLNQVKNGTRIILISGAFGCGKEYISNNLSEFLNKKGINSTKICMNSFYKSKPQLILDTYFATHFNHFDKDTYKSIIKTIEKYDISSQINKIYFELSLQIGTQFAQKIIEILKNEEKSINFNAKNATNYKKCANFCNSLNSFQADNVLIVYGAYALENAFILNLHNKNYKVFLNCNNNTLLLRNLNKVADNGEVELQTLNSILKNICVYKRYKYNEISDVIYNNNLSLAEINNFNKCNELNFDVKNYSNFLYKKSNSIILKNYYFSCITNHCANYFIKMQQENGILKDIKFVIKAFNNQLETNQFEKTFKISNKSTNALSVCTMFVKAGYPYAGSVRKNQTQYFYKDVEFYVNTYSSAQQRLKIKSGTKTNVLNLVNMLSKNNIQLDFESYKDEQYERQR